MAMFVHLTPESRIALIRRNGIRRVRRAAGEFPGGVFAVPVTRNFYVSHQWVRELKRRNQGAIAAASAERVQAEKQRAFLESTIRRDVAVAYRKYRAAAEALVLYTTQILPRAEENLRTVRAAYGIGEFSIFDVVSEQRRLTESVTGYNQSLRDYYIALTELETAIGTAIPAAGLSPGSTLIVSPDALPKQFDHAGTWR